MMRFQKRRRDAYTRHQSFAFPDFIAVRKSLCYVVVFPQIHSCGTKMVPACSLSRGTNLYPTP